MSSYDYNYHLTIAFKVSWRLFLEIHPAFNFKSLKPSFDSHTDWMGEKNQEGQQQGCKHMHLLLLSLWADNLETYKAQKQFSKTHPNTMPVYMCILKFQVVLHTLSWKKTQKNHTHTHNYSPHCYCWLDLPQYILIALCRCSWSFAVGRWAWE